MFRDVFGVRADDDLDNVVLLNDDAVGRWVDVTDGAMTATCR